MKDSVPKCRAEDHPHDGPPSGVVREESLRQAADFFEAMGDAARLRLLLLLGEGERCVTELVAAVGEKFSTVSQRLRILRERRLVVRRRKGTHVFYALADGHVADLIKNALAHADEM
jgi:ArsR family transcriptional regulator, lead/cadmium/zinc/bismuth-responsive transcriptional repressor